MQITEREVGGVTVLDAHGRLTANDGNRVILDRVDELLASGRRDLVLGLGDVSYMDSTCVGELISAFLKARNQGGALKLTGVTGRTAALFTTVRLDTVFDIFESETAALDSFVHPS